MSNKALGYRNSIGRFIRMRLAMLHELLIYLFSHPFSLIAAEISRLLGPVVYIPRIGYVVNSAEISRKILLDEVHFSKNGPGAAGAFWTQILGEKALTNMEGEEHRQFRAMLSTAFSDAGMIGVDLEILQRRSASLCRSLQNGETVDLVRFARLLTAESIFYVLGIAPEEPPSDEDYLSIFEHCDRLGEGVRIDTSRLSDDKVSRAQHELDQLTDPARSCYENGQIRTDSVIHLMSKAGMKFEDMRAIVAVLLLIGTGTVSNAIPRTVALLIDSGELGRLRMHPELMPKALDEGLRYVLPSPIILRSVARNTHIDGHHFKAGSRVAILLYNIMRDPKHYPGSRKFDITREQPAETRQLWFGAGPHFCPGIELTRRQMGAVINALIHTPGDVKIVKRRYRRKAFLPSYSKLDLKVANMF